MTMIICLKYLLSHAYVLYLIYFHFPFHHAFKTLLCDISNISMSHASHYDNLMCDYMCICVYIHMCVFVCMCYMCVFMYCVGVCVCEKLHVCYVLEHEKGI